MKHNLKITAIILIMFIVTQLIGLSVVNHYASEENKLPLGMETPPVTQESDYYSFFTVILIAFVIAIVLLLLLMKFNIEFVMRLWFFAVVVIALVISFMAISDKFKYAMLISLIFAVPLAFAKIYGRSFLIHNFTELFIYPGIAAVFVPILNIWTMIVLLILISGYDMWAVWHSGIMQKMARYQINKLNVFSGFFIPYISKKVKLDLKKLKKSELKKKKVKANVAILGGGDVIFPIIAAGVMLKPGFLPFTSVQIFQGGIAEALFVTVGATLGLGYLFFSAEKKKFYPAMPFITVGIFLGMLASYLFL